LDAHIAGTEAAAPNAATDLPPDSAVTVGIGPEHFDRGAVTAT
jgi:hypothetical protein